MDAGDGLKLSAKTATTSLSGARVWSAVIVLDFGAIFFFFNTHILMQVRTSNGGGAEIGLGFVKKNTGNAQ